MKRLEQRPVPPSNGELRVLHLVSYPLFSGPLPPTLGLAHAQRALGHTVYLAYDTERRPPNDYEEEARLRLPREGLDPPARLGLSIKGGPLLLWRDLRGLQGLTRGAVGVDVVHAHMTHDHALAALARAPVLVRTVHTESSLRPGAGRRWLGRHTGGWIVRCAEHRARLTAALGGADAAPVEVIPGGVDTEAFRPGEPDERLVARRRLGLPPDARVVVHAALIAGRGQEELVGALARLGDPRVHVLFAGRGERQGSLALSMRASGLEGRAHFLGYLAGHELLAAYHASDAAFVGSAGKDASRRGALEAMACGLPVIGAPAGALGELVDRRVGYPATSQAPTPIAAALRAWIDDGAEAAAARGRQGRERMVRERRFADEAARTVALYRRLVGAR